VMWCSWIYGRMNLAGDVIFGNAHARIWCVFVNAKQDACNVGERCGIPKKRKTQSFKRILCVKNKNISVPYINGYAWSLYTMHMSLCKM